MLGTAHSSRWEAFLGPNLAALASGNIALRTLGLGPPHSWPLTIALALIWLAAMYVYSPIADRIATYFAAKPPTLGAFRPLQRSVSRLLIGIIIAWIAGAFLEEFLLRGIILIRIETILMVQFPAIVSVALAVLGAACVGGVFHLYQGLRGAIIITQLSVLFGVLFVVSGYTLWSVVLCHGLYDTIAFVRFATGRSKYAKEKLSDT